MKTKILSLLILMPLFAKAQITQLTEAQKQEALNTVTQFCTLLQQWSNGQRTLDTRIYSLCSGKDCSAFDDVSSNKETTLRNYLLGIQKKYPRKLQMQISQPSLSACKITYEPIIGLSEIVGGAGGSVDPYNQNTMYDVFSQGTSNAFLIFEVGCGIPSLNISNTKYIIYDYKIRKVTAFITGDGTYLSYVEGLNSMIKKNYAEALKKFDIATKNERSSLKKQASICALYCCFLIGDVNNVVKYINNMNEPFVSRYMEACLYSAQGAYEQAFVAAKECERISQTKTEYSANTKIMGSIYMLLGVLYSTPLEYSRHYDVVKSIDYFRKAIKYDNVLAAYYLFTTKMENDDFDDHITDEEVIGYTKWAANQGHTGCALLLGKLAESINEIGTPEEWYKKGADRGDAICMACLGKYLIQKGSYYKDAGIKWVKKSLEGDVLDRYIDVYNDFVNDKWWPRTRKDVESLLNVNTSSNSGTSSNTYGHSTTSSSSSATSSLYTQSSSSTNYSNYNSYRYRSHHQFNEKKDDYMWGLSAGYFRKQWVLKADGVKTKEGMFGDDEYMNGVQFGLRFDPQFGYGIGINTGLFYEHCWADSDDDYDEYGSYHLTYREHGIYAPVHLKYTMNFSEWFQLSFFGGAGFNYVVSGKLRAVDGDDESDAQDFFDDDNMKRFNIMLEYGASIRVKCVQIDFAMSQGITKWIDNEDMVMRQGRPFSVSASVAF